MTRRLNEWLDRRAAARAERTERTAAEAGREADVGGACPATGEDVCVDETELPPGDSDESRLEGSLLEVGGAMAGLMPVERPEADDDKRKREETSPSSECEKCR